MVAGLYCFLWGKAKEMKELSHLPKAAAAVTVEAATATSQPARLHSAAVVPSASPTHQHHNNAPISGADLEQGFIKRNP